MNLVVHADKEWVDSVSNSEVSVFTFARIAFTSIQFWFLLGVIGMVTIIGLML